MSQHDFNIANQGFPSFRTDLNNALVALATTSSGTAEPATTYANQLWYETDTNILHIRDEANAAWLDLMTINQTTGSPSFNAGNVGIGTASPGAKLDVIGTSGSIVAELQVGANDDVALNFRNAAGTQVGYITSHVDSITLDGDFTKFSTGGTERMRIDSSGNVGIGTNAPVSALHLASTAGPYITFQDNDAGANQPSIGTEGTAGSLIYSTGGTSASHIFELNRGASEAARIDSSGNLLVGKNSSSLSTAGVELWGTGLTQITRSGGDVLNLNRLSTYGTIVDFLKDGTSVGEIGTASVGTFYVGGGDTTLTFSPAGDAIVPSGTDGATRSGAIDLGNSGNRWDTVFATVGTINTSDRTEKQDIEELNDAERRVAVACKGLLRKYRLKSAIAKKGEDARIHFGIIAQDLQAAFTAEGLDAGRYGMFINSTWTEEETGEEKSLMGVRYSELLAFIIAAL